MNSNFIKIVSKFSFTNLACFTRKFDLAYMAVFNTSFETYALHGVFDASRCMMSHLRWEVSRSSLTGLSRDYKVASCCTFGG